MLIKDINLSQMPSIYLLNKDTLPNPISASPHADVKRLQSMGVRLSP